MRFLVSVLIIALVLSLSIIFLIDQRNAVIVLKRDVPRLQDEKETLQDEVLALEYQLAKNTAYPLLVKESLESKTLVSPKANEVIQVEF